MIENAPTFENPERDPRQDQGTVPVRNSSLFEHPLSLVLDGDRIHLTANASSSLLRALRNAGHTSATGACEQGECGSCSVLIDGRVECSCLVPAVMCHGAQVQTARSLTRADLADALARHGAVQCGFCTPGIVVAAEAALMKHEPLDQNSAREALAGNICRCTGYQGIIDAVVEISTSREKHDQ